HTIIKVCNPNCIPCSKAHFVIDDLLENNKNVKIQIIYMVADDENDKSKTVKHFMALYEKNDTELIKKALDFWYADNKNYNDLSNKYFLNGELKSQGIKLNSMKKWCDETNISFTPTFFLNGFQLPNTYNIRDLKYLLNTLN
nr:thioredoxin domain-containing protein [Nitrosopumilus sp.]